MFKINNIEINKNEILHLLNNGKKIQAIKIIKDKTSIGLKDCKDIVDNLEMNPNYYDGQSIDRTSVASLKKKQIKSRRTKGSHVISDDSSHTKNYIIITLVILIAILVYLYSIK